MRYDDFDLPSMLEDWPLVCPPPLVLTAIDMKPFAERPDPDPLTWNDPPYDWLWMQLERFSYKPGWHAHILKERQTIGMAMAGQSEYRLALRFNAEDSRGSGRKIPIQATYRIPRELAEHGKEEHFADWLANCLRVTEHH